MIPLYLTGIGSVSPYGVFSGVIPKSPLEARLITHWENAEARRAYTVEPFRPAQFVPGIKTRRLDRLSTWALVASSLAIQDAGIDLAQVNRSRVAIVLSTNFGCVELTEAFLHSAATRGWAATDPILFPETLANSPASHVALFHQLRGPNITVAAKSFGAESALLQAASLLRHGHADIAIVLAGDVLTQAIYQWYEQAGVLSPECFSIEPTNSAAGFIPSEGMAAIVMEGQGRNFTSPYARLIDGHWASGGDTLIDVRRLMDNWQPTLVICTCNGEPCANCISANSAGKFIGPQAQSIPPERFAAGLADTGGLFHLILAMRGLERSENALMLGTSGAHGHAAVRLEVLPV
jgi:hypothetical protein